MSMHGKKEVEVPIMIRRLLTLIAASTSLWGGLAQADPLAICRAGNPQFPQLCECAIGGRVRLSAKSPFKAVTDLVSSISLKRPVDRWA